MFFIILGIRKRGRERCVYVFLGCLFIELDFGGDGNYFYVYRYYKIVFFLMEIFKLGRLSKIIISIIE